MKITDSLNNELNPEPAKAIHFTKNEDGHRESIEREFSASDKKEIDVVIVGHGEQIKSQILHILATNDSFAGKIVLVPIHDVGFLGMKASEEIIEMFNSPIVRESFEDMISDMLVVEESSKKKNPYAKNSQKNYYNSKIYQNRAKNVRVYSTRKK